jgi:hypothetical protein
MLVVHPAEMVNMQGDKTRLELNCAIVNDFYALSIMVI